MEVIKLTTAAKILGISPQALRERMKAGVYDIGVVYKPKGSSHYSYDIFKGRFESLIGRQIEERELK